MVNQILKTGDFRHTKMANAVEYDDFEDRAVLRIQGLNPIYSTLNLQPYTLKPKPYTMNHEP